MQKFAPRYSQLRRISIAVATIAIMGILTGAVFVLWECHRTTPQPIPRNVKVCFGYERYMRLNPINNLFELSGNTLTVIRLPIRGGSWNVELGEYPRAIFDFEDYELGMEYAELIETAVLDAFNESFPFSSRTNDSDKIYVMRGAVELSQEQLEYVWRLIDCVVRNYEVPFRLDTNQHLSPPAIRVAIDGVVYQSRFSSYEPPPRSRDFRIFQRSSENIASISDDSTLRLVHHLIDLSPIPTGWESFAVAEQ